jgi:ATP-dependent RNA helicase RhlE
MSATSFAALGLRPELLKAVSEAGYTTPTPIQTQAIPVVLAGKDVMGGAQTGTGKTAGFALPILQKLAPMANTSPSPARHPVRALILTPTRELAAQIEESVRTYGRHLKLRTALVYGGVGFTPQVEALKRGVDILVATPGRLLDHLGQRTLSLAHVEILVLDEADRMLDMGFIHDIRKVLRVLPANRQNLLFSATYSDEIRTLADSILRDPVQVEVARRNAESELVTQRIHPVDQGRKRALLAHLVASGDWRQVLVFTRTKHGANRLAEQLCKDGIEATAIHGNKSQGARTRALADFKAGEMRVLVATDIAARGLDIEELPHVVNYELPNVPEHYVHRIGRTGRAGIPGEAISLVSPDEYAYLNDIEKVLKRKLERKVVPGFESGAAAPSRPQPSGADRQPQRSNPAPRHAPRAEPPAARPQPRPVPRAPDRERQPASHANAQFPSSGPAPAAAPRRGGHGERGRPAQVPALLRGAPRRTS